MTPSSFSYVNLANIALLEELYAKYLIDPNSVDPSWRYFFEGMQFAAFQKMPSTAEGPDLRILHLIQAYRTYGHLSAKINPIALQEPELAAQLLPEKYHFQKEDFQKQFPTDGLIKQEFATLQTILSVLQKTYCGSVGIEYKDIGRPELEDWLQKTIEPGFVIELSPQQKIQILEFLNKAELFESFLHTKYVGQKRFSLEGGETLIPMLDFLVEKGATIGLKEVVLGMAHRGRLNVLTNILGKSFEQVFHEFEDHFTPELSEGMGDVKYHKGFDGSLKTHTGKDIKVLLTANPSHLESVDPVVCGAVKAKQDRLPDDQKSSIVPILIHGDAALAGQGVVYETMQFSGLAGYSTKGTIHIVINNQIGFTALPEETRSTRYCTDIAKTFGAPVFHVNVEDPEGCVYAAILAIEIRQKFGCDVFLDLNCYRKYGHNESDEPTFTQPLEYQLIRSKKTVREIYLNRLVSENVITASQSESLQADFKKTLEEAIEKVKTDSSTPPAPKASKADLWKPVPTAVLPVTLQNLAKEFCTPKEGFELHPKIRKRLQEHLEMIQDPNASKVDWGMAEHLAFASLLVENISIRLSGQDSGRGTFSHRQSVWIDQKEENSFIPLNHLSKRKGLYEVYNSPLSEFGVLGFEFGYSTNAEKMLVMWEAQFGDFSNGAQIIIDQYIAPAQQKWGILSSLVLLLPHGYEGQGPEHSSARIERFLQLCGQDNMIVVNCTTPAQFFHLLRRQVYASYKKPLVVFTPKALLRHPMCVSRLEDFGIGFFQEILDDSEPSLKPEQLVFCSGKIYYDLVQERKARAKEGMTILRIEQLYPFPEQKLEQHIEKYKGFKECYWVQEEHKNMGAYEFMARKLEKLTGKPLVYIGRITSASPATGSFQIHKKEHKKMMDELFGGQNGRTKETK